MIKKKKKSLGSINLSVTMDPMTKEEMNEVSNLCALSRDGEFQLIFGSFLLSAVFEFFQVHGARLSKT